MTTPSFRTTDGRHVPAVTADQMRRVDRVAVDEIGVGLLQMMENAGRTLARHAGTVADGGVTVLAGNGGNGGGGLACARHLANHDHAVDVVLDRPADEFDGAAGQQLAVLDRMDVPIEVGPDALSEQADTTVDALVGYGLSGEVRGTAADLVRAVGDRDGPVVSLDVPTGVDATSGEVLGVAVEPDRTVTLALPKAGLQAVGGDLFLAAIGLPAVVFQRAGIEYENPYGTDYWVELARA